MFHALLTRLLLRVPPPVLDALNRWRWGRHSPLLMRVLDAAARPLRSGVVVIPNGVARGLRIDANGENASYALGTNEPLVQDVFTAHVRPGAVVYDVGANIGFFTLIAARLAGPDGHVYAFEPSPETADRLDANLGLNGVGTDGMGPVDVIRAGVGGAEGTASLSDPAMSQWASLVIDAPAPAGAPADAGRAIRMVALDGLLREGRIRPPSFVKIDIEGAEVDALRGMSGVLEAHRPVVLCEVHDTHEAVADFFASRPYRVSVVETSGDLRGAPNFVHALAVPTAG